MGRRSIGLIVAVALGIGTPASAATPAERFQAVLDETVAAHPVVPGAAMYLDGSRVGLPWQGASGETAQAGGVELKPEDPYRIASTTKPFTAATVLRLAEDGRVSLEDRIAKYLPPEIVDRIHVYNGVNYGPQITIRQLLQHTSGLNSHDSCNEFAVAIATQPQHRWSAEEQVELMIDCGDPHFPPGEGWRYSDTGYVILGSIVRRVTGTSLGAAYRSLLSFRRLGLDSTWYELTENPPTSRERAHQYFHAYDFTDHDPSFDSWGGGGLDSTSRDLARYVRALFEGRVFRRPSTLETMLQMVPSPAAADGAIAYGLGMGEYDVHGIRCFGHPGFWSVFMLYCPALDAALAGTTNQAADETGSHTERELYEGAVEVLQDLPAARRQMRLRVIPKRTRAGRLTRFRFWATVDGLPISAASIRFAGRGATTDERGRASVRVRFRRAGRRRARACADGYRCARVAVRVASPARRARHAVRSSGRSEKSSGRLLPTALISPLRVR